MVAFAVGGLLGDTLFHLLPEIFLGEDQEERARFVLVEPNRNLVLGLAILVGFMVFVAMDKGLRIVTGGTGHEHGHGHGVHSHGGDEDAAVVATGVEGVGEGALKARKKTGKKGEKAGGKKGPNKEKEVNPSVKLGGYLNLMCVLPVLPLREKDKPPALSLVCWTRARTEEKEPPSSLVWTRNQKYQYPADCNANTI